MGLQRAGAGQVRRVKLLRSDPYRHSRSATGPADTRPKVRVRNATFTKGKSEHSRAAPVEESGVGSTLPMGADGIPRVREISEQAPVEESGVGFTLQMGADGIPRVREISEQAPAGRNGCAVLGEKVVAINDVPTLALSYFKCAQLLNGPMGTTVTLDLASDDGDEAGQQRVSLRRTWVPDVVWDPTGEACWPRPDAVDEGRSKKQSLHGVGITFIDKNGAMTVKRIADGVKRIADGGPAALAGSVRVGDVIKTVDGVEIEGKSKQKFARLMLGPSGSIAQLGIERGPALMLGPSGSIAQLGIERGPASEQHLVQLARGPADPSAPPGATPSFSNVLSESSSDSLSSIHSSSSSSSPSPHSTPAHNMSASGTN
ncbi:hypothetical protein T484DRAFT_1888566, partial [Baffinella frigidus]